MAKNVQKLSTWFMDDPLPEPFVSCYVVCLFSSNSIHTNWLRLCNPKIRKEKKTIFSKAKFTPIFIFQNNGMTWLMAHTIMGEDSSGFISPNIEPKLIFDNTNVTYSDNIYIDDKLEQHENTSLVESNSTPSQIPAAIMVPTGILLYILSLLTFVGNAMVLHAIRTDKRLQTVSQLFLIQLSIEY